MRRMTATVARLYRYPVKGMSAEPCDRLRVLASGAPEGDRVLGFLLQSALAAPDREMAGADWWRKERFTVLMNTPGLARLAAAFDADTRRLEVRLDGRTLAVGDVADPADRRRLADAVTAYVRGLDDSSLKPGDALHLVGDGATPRFHDRGPRHVTLMASASVAALAEVIGAEVDERRFRMNVVLDGLRPWEELEWIGRSVRVGALEFEVTGPVIRCLATHANPVTGERDLQVMTTLTRGMGQDEPTMGVLAVPRSGGELTVGDAATAG